MKKVLTICMVVLMLAGISLNALAAPSGFVSSPSGNKAPAVEEFTAGADECTATLVVTPFTEKETLPDTLKDLFEQAYDSITETKDLTSLNDLLKKVAEDKSINPQNLAVSDLFDIHATDCEFHDGHKEFDITLSAETLGSFVGLLHMKKDGVWELVEDARVTQNGTHLQFSVESFSPFAIVVDTSTIEVPPTGDNIMTYVWLTSAAAAAFVACVAVFAVSNKKSKAN